MIETLRMGKMFGLASLWESRGSEKINGDTKYAMAQGVPIPRTLVSFPKPNIKRKRDDDVEEIVLEEEKEGLSANAKRRREETATLQSRLPKYEESLEKIPPTTNDPLLEAASEEIPTTNMDSTSNTNALRGILESQIGLEILLKHDELRLINQELAKCQVALEQLRRCHLIPYPTSKASPFDPVDVSNGSGPAIEPEQGMPRPEWNPAYGVTDGPYTRHYAKWLIPDPMFDGIQPDWAFEEVGLRGSRQAAEGRTTRNSFADVSTSVGARSRTHRGSSTQKLQALSNGYPQPKGKAGPCTLKRSDGQLVKLICRDCNREDFSSTQGFINHCRIAHKRDYKSHEEAAIACGEPIELDDVGAIVGDEKSPVFANGLVHPLIKSTPADKETYLSLMSHIGASIEKFRLGELPGVKAIPTSTPSTPNVKIEANQNENFVSSSGVPFLSKFLKNKGFDGNLDEMVTKAKMKIDQEEPSSNDEEDSDAEKKSKSSKHRGQQYNMSSDFQAPPQMRVPARSTISPAPFGRPVSSKGLDRNKSGISPRLSYATPINTTAANHNRHSLHVIDSLDREGDTNTMISDPSPICDLSPNTVASNNDLPALVSDDGEYEDEDNDDDGKSLASEMDEDEDSDVAEISIEDGESTETAVVARAAGRGLRKEHRHVTFVSPVKDAKGGKKDGRGRK